MSILSSSIASVSCGKEHTLLLTTYGSVLSFGGGRQVYFLLTHMIVFSLSGGRGFRVTVTLPSYSGPLRKKRQKTSPVNSSISCFATF